MGVEVPLAEAGVEVALEVTWSDGWKLRLVGLKERGRYTLRKSRSVESMRMFGPIRFGPNAQILLSEKYGVTGKPVDYGFPFSAFGDENFFQLYLEFITGETFLK